MTTNFQVKGAAVLTTKTLQPKDLIIRRPRSSGSPWSIWKSLEDREPAFVQELESRSLAEGRAKLLGKLRGVNVWIETNNKNLVAL